MFEYRAVTYFLTVGILFAVFSTPFLLGILEPTLALHNPYALIYAVLNLPITYFFKDFIAWMAWLAWDAPTANQMQTMSIIVSGMFWSIAGALIGQYKDLREGRRTSSFGTI